MTVLNCHLRYADALGCIYRCTTKDSNLDLNQRRKTKQKPLSVTERQGFYMKASYRCTSRSYAIVGMVLFLTCKHAALLLL